MRNRIDDLINTLVAEDRMTDLERELDQVTFWKLRSSERETWHYAWGMAAFRRGDYAQALQRFEKGRAAAPRSARIAFALGQEYERVGRVADMLAVFDACPFPRVPSAYALMQARFAYLWDRPQKALQYVLPILDAYEALQIADDHFFVHAGVALLQRNVVVSGSIPGVDRRSCNVARAYRACPPASQGVCL